MVIAVDFDGTIVTHDYPRIGKPIPFAIQTLKKLQAEDHHQLILWTVRERELLQAAVDYCASKGLEFYAVNSNYPEEDPAKRVNRKVTADLYIDDRNLGGLPDWGVIYNMIHSGRASQPVLQNTTEDLQSRKKGVFARLFS
ncbi:MAG: BT0820 family HAD-type phosphatase [Paludibacteraceae bacterium]